MRVIRQQFLADCPRLMGTANNRQEVAEVHVMLLPVAMQVQGALLEAGAQMAAC
jgi:hypothetical protein